MRKVNPDAKKAMKLMYSEKIGLKEAWKRVKRSRSVKLSKRSRHRISSAKNSLKLNRKKMCKSSKKCRRSKRRSRGFGSVSENGPGYLSSSSASVSTPYFGKSEPVTLASEWWSPVSNGRQQYPEIYTKN